jgi:hypothetical protein
MTLDQRSGQCFLAIHTALVSLRLWTTSLSLPVGFVLEPLPWRTLIELDRKARSANGWVDKTNLIRCRSNGFPF